MYAECNEYVNVVNVIRSCCNGTNVDTAVNMELTATQLGSSACDA